MWRCRLLLLCLRARVVLCMDLASGLKHGTVDDKVGWLAIISVGVRVMASVHAHPLQIR
jgi:hypothetical protein